MRFVTFSTAPDAPSILGLVTGEDVVDLREGLEGLVDVPVRLSKPGTAVVGPGEPIEHNATMTEQLDWECELAVVIGRAARKVPESEALDYVFGYSIINDISARDQRRSGQWFFSKGQDSYAPFGPMIVTTDEITDPHTLRLTLTVNGDQRQDGNSRNMLFKIPALLPTAGRCRGLHD